MTQMGLSLKIYSLFYRVFDVSKLQPILSYVDAINRIYYSCHWGHETRITAWLSRNSKMTNNE